MDDGHCCARCGFGGVLTLHDDEEHLEIKDAWLCSRCENALDDGEWSLDEKGWRKW
jgi:ribosomal protein S27AE